MRTTIIDALARGVSGKIDVGAEAVRKLSGALWKDASPTRPHVLVECRSVPDIRASVRVASSFGVPISVLGGGHDWAGRAMCNDGLTLDLRPLKMVDVNHSILMVTVGGGALVDDVLNRLPSDLVVVAGTISTVGMTGFALGAATASSTAALV